MRHVTGKNIVGVGLFAGVGAAIVLLGLFEPRVFLRVFRGLAVGLSVLTVLALLPPLVLAIVLRTIKLRDRHAYIRMVPPSRGHALSPAAFGNSNGGRNVS
jgi:hypothetical protein